MVQFYSSALALNLLAPWEIFLTSGKWLLRDFNVYEVLNRLVQKYQQLIEFDVFSTCTNVTSFRSFARGFSLTKTADDLADLADLRSVKNPNVILTLRRFL